MSYQGLTILLIIIEGLLIIISLKYLHKISLTSKDFSAVFDKARAEGSRLFKEIKELIAVTNKREDNILSIVFHLEEIEMYMKQILSKFEQQEKLKATEEVNLTTNIDKDYP